MPAAAPRPSSPPILSGRDAGTGGIPEIGDLPLATRAVVGATSAFDVGLRAAAASLVAATTVPAFLRPGFAAWESEQLGFYAELAAHADAARSFPAPSTPVKVSSGKAGPLAYHLPGGRVSHLRFISPFETVNPAAAKRYRRYRRNGVAHAQHWSHDDGPRPTICVIHGFMGSPYLLNGRFFSLPWFFRAGFDVLLYTLPFHGARREWWSPYSGYGFFSHGFSVMAEAMANAVHDFRLFVDHLEGLGVEQVGVTGLSLGGYTAALLAAVEPRLRVVVPNVAVSDFASLLAQWQPAGALLGFASHAGLLPPAGDFHAALGYHSPLTYEPVVAKRRRLIITGLGDRLASPEQSRKLWEHWDRCALYWFPGNHIAHVNQSTYLRRMARFMRGIGFAPADWLGQSGRPGARH